jgi:hypothetical protein
MEDHRTHQVNSLAKDCVKLRASLEKVKKELLTREELQQEQQKAVARLMQDTVPVSQAIDGSL